MIMKDAYAKFSEHQNMKVFVNSLRNGTVTPFIMVLSELNGKDPRINAAELANRISVYIDGIFKLTTHFGVQKYKSLEDYINNDKNASGLAFEYLNKLLSEKHHKEEMQLLYYTIIEPYRAN